MELDRSSMIRSIESLKNTPMSEADMKAIAVYPDEVIAYADRQTMKKGSLVNPIGYFLVCCREYSKKRLARDGNPTSRLETREESLQKGNAKPTASKVLMTLQEKIANSERIDKLCTHSLRQCQANMWIKQFENGNMTQDLLERMLSSIDMLDSCRHRIVHPGSNLT